MIATQLETVRSICERHGRDAGRLMDIAREVQSACGCVDPDAVTLIAEEVNAPRVEVESLVTFYSFFSEEPKGKVVIRLSNDIIDRMAGFEHVKQVFCEELGVGLGETTEDGLITLEETACIGMCDQAPAALVNDVVVTELSSDKARQIVKALRQHGDPSRLVRTFGDGNNAHPLVRSMVANNLRKPGEIIFSPMNRGEAIRKALAITPSEVIRAVKTARLRGRGGAGFPAGMKWEFTRMAQGSPKYVVCNADEGEPGTFKDRVILTERADRVFAGMTIAGYAIGASEGVMYLRGEYAYLKAYLEDLLEKRRAEGLLGRSVLGKEGFDFDIRIQLGAGAYVCGEETSLISSMEGTRGDPKNRPPFPAQKGYHDCPTVVNNVETLACVTKILEEGPASFGEYGTEQSSGTKLLSISGDCSQPGVYEVEFGITLAEVLEMCGGGDAVAMQISGPSGQLVGREEFSRKVCFDDLACGGSVMVFGPERDLLEIVHAFMSFFEEESCGYCTPCRVGNTLLKDGIERVMDGRGEPRDLKQFSAIGEMMKRCSRCGFGQTSANPVLTSMLRFPKIYEEKIREHPQGYRQSFDLSREVTEAERITGRKSHYAHNEHGKA